MCRNEHNEQIMMDVDVMHNAKWAGHIYFDNLVNMFPMVLISPLVCF